MISMGLSKARFLLDILLTRLVSHVIVISSSETKITGD
jgi:hypothetical protein